MTTVPNEARGEVGITIDGQDYVIAPTFGRMAQFQKAVDVRGLEPLALLLGAVDAEAVYQGVRTLVPNIDMTRFDGAPFKEKEAQKIATALLKALAGEKDQGNAEGATGSAKSDSSLRADG